VSVSVLQSSTRKGRAHLQAWVGCSSRTNLPGKSHQAQTATPPSGPSGKATSCHSGRRVTQALSKLAAPARPLASGGVQLARGPEAGHHRVGERTARPAHTTATGRRASYRSGGRQSHGHQSTPGKTCSGLDGQASLRMGVPSRAPLDSLPVPKRPQRRALRPPRRIVAGAEGATSRR